MIQLVKKSILNGCNATSGCRNKRPVLHYESIAMASRAEGINESTLGGRLRRGWSDWDALYGPVGRNPYHDHVLWPKYRKSWLRKQAKAKALREKKYTYKEIADTLQCSERKAFDLVNRAIPAFI